MERTMSVEDKIRRAEEIYYRRKAMNQGYISSIKEKPKEKKDFKLFKKMIIQILVCLTIYSGYYLVKHNQYVFSEDLMNKTNEILSYDINFNELYQKMMQNFQSITSKSNEENIGGAENQEEPKSDEQENVIQPAIEEKKEESNLSQMEKDSIDIKNTISFIKPVEGEISSKFGLRDPTTSTVPKNHTGLDIAATEGTVIKSATDGEVILVSSEGDYGNHLKVKNGDVVIVYAHCKTLYVKQGDKISQGQNIGEVGSTGNSTGPHLHFEVRKQDRLVDPQMILDF